MDTGTLKERMETLGGCQWERGGGISDAALSSVGLVSLCILELYEAFSKPHTPRRIQQILRIDFRPVVNLAHGAVDTIITTHGDRSLMKIPNPPCREPVELTVLNVACLT